MNRKLLCAALASAAPFVAMGVRAESLPDQMFLISTPAAGIVDYKGVGTASFNQSQGTNQSMTVGSNSIFGVNAAASNSSDYASQASATLALTEASTLKQINGTASNAFTSYLSGEQATTTVSDGDGNEFEVDNSVSSIQAIINIKHSPDSDAALRSLSDSFNAGATASANSIHGAAYDQSSGQHSSEADYESQWQSSYTNAYTEAYNAAAAELGQSESTSQVDVIGLGSLADITTQDSTTFTAESDRVTQSTTGQEGGTGNASSQGNLASTSYVNVSETSTASGFMQAFHGGAPKNLGELTLVDVQQNNDGTYSVHGQRTVSQTETYTTDASGNITGSPAVN